MDYKERYEQALEVMRQWIAPCHTPEQLEAMKKSVFPELRESEDERIRKGLVKLLTVASEAYLVESTGVKKDSYLAYLEKQKEQKPGETSDFKTKLAEYLHNNSPKDGQYVISAESILQMAKEELLKRGELQNPAELSKEETKDLVHILKVLDDCYIYGKHDLSKTDYDNLTSTLKSLRPSWKPSEEQMRCLDMVLCDEAMDDNVHRVLVQLREQLKRQV